MDGEKAPKMKTLYWTMKLLEQFDGEHDRRGVTELAALTQIPKASVSNALSTFEQLGYVRRHMQSGKYSLGPKAVCLYHNFFAGNRDAMLYRSECRTLSDRTDSIVQVCFVMEGRLICLAGAAPARYVQADMSGSEMPIHSTAAGKALLAFMDGRQRRQIYDKGLKAMTVFTITDPARLEEEMEKVRRREHATDTMENEYGMCSVAVPLWSNDSHTLPPRYAISVTVPAEKLENDQVFDLVKIIRDSHREARMALSRE